MQHRKLGAPEHPITFSFGRNWNQYLEGVSDSDIVRAMHDIEEWLGKGRVRGRRVIDVGSGSGIHSLSFVRLGAAYVLSFDFDTLSVGATRKLRDAAGSPSNWKVEHGSILDESYANSLGKFEIVYSWGVLHHTGAMWEAIDRCMSLAAPGGLLWISIYTKGKKYVRDLALKQKFNSSSELGKRWLIGQRILRIMLRRARQGQNPFKWNQKIRRGMNVYNDIVDWLGGLPYETATADEVLRFARERHLVLERIKVAPEGGCSVYVFSRPADRVGG